jgi:hypothetical protein
LALSRDLWRFWYQLPIVTPVVPSPLCRVLAQHLGSLESASATWVLRSSRWRVRIYPDGPECHVGCECSQAWSALASAKREDAASRFVSAVDYVDRNSVDALQSAAGCAGAYHTDPPLAPYRFAALRDALSTVIAGLIAGPLSDAS